ncbi:MAG: carboxypeptidase regulatory-like domain-containing protein [Chloracidobacterium sp.]|nr:carboxypeptidase regulatory-like domain-containing protein [Chloracidobacterium sp.]
MKTVYSEQNVRKIHQIGVCGCGRVDFPALYDSSISGRVTEGGKAVPLARVAIVRADEKASSFNTLVGFGMTDVEGRFSLVGVPPGEYVLGVNITVAPNRRFPYRPTWYPDAASRQEAVIIKVGQGQKLSSYDIVMPRKLAERIIEGTIVWRDGRPAAKVFVHLVSSAHARSGYGAGELNSVQTDGQGHFKITGYEGIPYYVVASSAPTPVEAYRASSVHFYSEPLLLEPKGGYAAGLRLKLSWDKETLREFFEKVRDQQLGVADR